MWQFDIDFAYFTSWILICFVIFSILYSPQPKKNKKINWPCPPWPPPAPFSWPPSPPPLGRAAEAEFVRRKLSGILIFLQYKEACTRMWTVATMNVCFHSINQSIKRPYACCELCAIIDHPILSCLNFQFKSSFLNFTNHKYIFRQTIWAGEEV